MTQLLVDQAYALLQSGRAQEALAVTAGLVQGLNPTHPALAAHATVLKALGRSEEALGINERATRAFAGSGVAWHNLAATLADLGRGAEAKRAAERAFAAGLDAPETWLVYAHAHVALQDTDAAVRAFREVLRRRPADVTAAQELARLLWMVTGNWREAVEPLRLAQAAGAPSTALVMVEARILEAARRRDELHALFARAVSQNPRDVILVRAAAHAWLEDGELDRADELVERALALAPFNVSTLVELAAVRLAQGRGEEALAAARRSAELAPLDQSTWGWVATASRAVDGADHRKLYDYGAFVRDYMIETPAGWASLDAFLADLAKSLRRLHVLKVEPSDQTLRDGTQTLIDLARSDDPVLQAFFAALDKPIRAYLAELGSGDDPLRSRNTLDYAVHSAWSVLLKPNGFHVNHYHPLGWISSAFYVEVPKGALDRADREGWIKFGEPPWATVPPQPPEHFVKPEPGKLVLFPSYMWHGTVPFSTPESRMTIAFDVVPKSPQA
jgi:uncharacterized protein (TIGR02466 family)